MLNIKNKAAKDILFVFIVTLCLLSLLEIFLFITVRFPTIHKILPNVITKMSERIYALYDMKIIQFLPEIAQFDPSLGYTLRPGKSVFSNSEFTTEYTVNSLGVRDTEEALNYPEIIVLGDSYAMGWGVNQNETFAKLIEVKTGFKVLNASIASYGTAREMGLLKRIKREKVKYLIVQYCDNDYEDNLDFLRNGNKLITMSKQKYERTVEDHRVDTRYYLGKYTLACANIIKGDFLYIFQNVFKIGDTIETREKRYKRPNDEVDLFLNVLMNSGIELLDVQLIVFDADPFNNSFVTSLKKELSYFKYPMFIKNMIVLDASQFLKRDHILLLDGHYNKLGHQLVAGMILRHINP